MHFLFTRVCSVWVYVLTEVSTICGLFLLWTFSRPLFQTLQGVWPLPFTPTYRLPLFHFSRSKTCFTQPLLLNLFTRAMINLENWLKTGLVVTVWMSGLNIQEIFFFKKKISILPHSPHPLHSQHTEVPGPKPSIQHWLKPCSNNARYLTCCVMRKFQHSKDFTSYFLFLCFLGPHSWHMEVPSLGV